MPTPPSEPKSVESLAEEYLDRLRRGEQPAVEEYAEQNPQLAGEIREFFPALRLVENFKPDSRDKPPGGRPDRGQDFESELKVSVPERLGDYHIIREVARGGMGVVYEAVQESLGRPVALKVLPHNALPDVRRQKRFEREARAAAKLHHTNIVPVFGVGEVDGVHYYAMQFINGLGLDQVLNELRRIRSETAVSSASEIELEQIGSSAFDTDGNGGGGLTAQRVAHSLATGQIALLRKPDAEELQADDSDSAGFVIGPRPSAKHGEESKTAATPTPGDTDVGKLSDTATYALPGHAAEGSGEGALSTYWQSVARIGVQVADALQYAHDHGILHRDVKPSNLLLDAHGTVWVTDFGLAKADDHDDLTRTGDVVGTLRYMAPELFNGKADARSDVYSLGLTLYELLAMRPAYDETHRHTLIRQVMHESPPRLRTLDRQIPRDLETVVHKATDRGAAQRYQTAEELAADLRRFLGDEPIRARRISPVARLTRWCRRNKMVASLSGLISLLITAGAAVATIAAASFHNLANEKSDALNASLAAEELTRREQQATERALKREVAAGRRERLRLAQMELLRGRMLCGDGRIGEGLLWMARSLNTADSVGPIASDLERVIRFNLDGWKQRICPLQTVVDARFRLSVVAVNPRGEYATTGTDSAKRQKAIVWNLAADQPVVTPLANKRFSSRQLAFSPDGRHFFDHRRDVTIWDAVTRKKVRTLEHPGAPIEHFAISRDSRLIATGCRNGEVRLWEVASGKPVGKTMQHPLTTERLQSKGILHMVFTPDGKTLLTTRQSTARFWNVATCATIGEPIAFRRGLIISQAAFSPDGRRLVIGTRSLEIFDVQTRKLIGQIAHRDRASIYCLAFSPDGKLLLTGGADHVIRFWSMVDGKPLGQPLAHNYMVTQMVFSPDGQLLIVRSGNSVRLWSVRDRRLLVEPVRHRESLTKLVCAPDGKSFLTHSRGGLTRIWRMPVEESLQIRTRPGGSINRVAFWPEDETYAMAGQRVAVHPRSIRLIPTGLPYPTMVAAFDSQGRFHALVSDVDPETRKTGLFRVYLVETFLPRRRTRDRLLMKLAAPPIPIGPRCDELAISPDGRRVVTLIRGKQTRLWDPHAKDPEKRFLAVQSHRRVTAVGFHPGGKYFITIGSDGSIKRWDADSGQPQRSVFQNKVGSRLFAFSPDGSLIAFVGNDQTVTVWNVANGKRHYPPLHPPTALRAIALSSDNRTIITGGLDGGIRMWDGATSEQLGPTLRHRSAIKSIAIRSDGLQLLSSARLEYHARRWRVPRPMTGSAAMIRRQLEIETGLELTDAGTIRELDANTWRERRAGLR